MERVAAVDVVCKSRDVEADFLREVPSQVPESAQAMVTVSAADIFQRQSREEAQAMLAHVCALLSRWLPKALDHLEEAEEELLACNEFPPEHWRQPRRGSPSERLNKDLKWRSAVVVGIPATSHCAIQLLRKMSAVQDCAWMAALQRFSEASMNRIAKAARAGTHRALVAA